MSVFKCKMCGGTLNIQDGQMVTECEYCGTKQTLPKLNNDDRRANLYERAGQFRRDNEFDKAIEIYEQLLCEDGTDAEVYWSLVLCKYGIEYVEDPLTQRRVPTIHRAQFTSIFDDTNYKSALAYADAYQRTIYEEEARTINEIQKGILVISQKEDPFDIFICYKETDAHGMRTHDSVLANDLYYLLKGEGFKVFFARITLESKLGTAYEPYIFAALHSASVMVVIGTKPEYFNAVWVKNEWSRFLSLIRQGEKKVLIPAYRDMDPYELPKEFSHLQALDMSKLGFMQDLIRGIKKILGRDKKTPGQSGERSISSEGAKTAPLLRRAFLFLEDGEFEHADEYAEKILDLNPECAEAYLVKLLVELKCNKEEGLLQQNAPISTAHHYGKVIRFATPEYRAKIEGYDQAIQEKIEMQRLEGIYQNALYAMKKKTFDQAITLFNSIANFKDAKAKAEECSHLKEEERLEHAYQRAFSAMNSGHFEQAISLFSQIEDYRDVKEKISLCREKWEEARKEKIYKQAMARLNNKIDDVLLQSVIEELTPLSGWRDIDEQIRVLKQRIEEYHETCKERKYRSALARLNENKVDDVLLQSVIEELMPLSGWRDVDEQIRILNQRIEEYQEARRIAEEQEQIRQAELQRERERRAEILRVMKEKVKKHAKEIAIIGGSSVGFVTIVLVLIFSLIVPSTRVKRADKLFELGEYEEALVLYEKADGFGESEARISEIQTVQSGVKKITDNDIVGGIKLLISRGVPVKVVYATGGGDFSGNSYLGLPDENQKVALLSSFKAGAHTLDVSNQEGTIEYTYENPFDFFELKKPAKAGYIFDGWNLMDYSYIIQDGIFQICLDAKWVAKEYTIDYDLNGGVLTDTNPNKYSIGDNFTLHNPTKEHYIFLGWTGTGLDTCTETVTIHSDDIGNRTYIANWKSAGYVVSFDANGGNVSVGEMEVYADESYTFPTPTKTGYIFLGWYNGDTKYTDAGTWKETNGVALTAKWRANTYIISLDANGGSVSPTSKTATYDSSYNLPTPTKTGYTFLGWYNGTIKYTSGTWKEANNVTLTAKWQPNTYIIALDANGGSVSSTAKSVTYGSGYLLPTPTKTGYTFLGWYDDRDTKYTSGTWKEANNVTLTAKWQANTYTIAFYANGGTVSQSSKTVTYGSSYTLPTPTKTGYTFLGWYDDRDTKYTSGTWKETNNVALTAKWQANTYTITLDANGGSVSPTSKTATYDSSYTLPTPTKTGYTFLGWYDDRDTKYISGTWKEANNVTLTAKWQANTYTIVLDANGGSVSPTLKTVTYDSIYNLPTPTKTGYTFLGWYNGTIKYTSGTWKEANNLTLRAEWMIEEGVLFEVSSNGQYAIVVGYAGSATEVQIPQIYKGLPVKEIGSYAFSGCDSLTSVTIPDSVTSIGSSVFSGCSSLKTLTIPFVGGSKTATTVSESTLFGYIFGTSSYTGGIATKQYYSSSSYETYYIPSALENVTVTGGRIHDRAFYNCDSLTSVTILNSVTGIGSYAFYYCDSLASVTIPDSVTSIGRAAFSHCDSLTSVTIPNSVTSIGPSAFFSCSSLTSVTIGNSVTSIGDSAFNYCRSLTSVTIGNNVTSIEDDAFSECDSLTSVTIPNSVTKIGSQAFYYCTSLTSVTIPDSVTSIGDSAFNYCISLTSVTIGNSVTSIGYRAFGSCSNLKSVSIGNSVTSIGEEAFYYCKSLTSVTIPNSVTSIGDGAFKNCTNLTIICEASAQPSTWSTDWNISDCDVIWGNSQYFTWISTNDGIIITGYIGPNIDTLVIPKTINGSAVVEIGESAFAGNTYINSVFIPYGVKVINTSAFRNCSALYSVSIPDSVTSIGSSVFSGCSSLKSLTIPFVGGSKTATSASSSTLFGYIFGTSSCTGGIKVEQYYDSTSSIIYYIPSTLENVTVTGGDIRHGAFWGCKNLTSVTIGDNVTSIGDYAFYYCTSLTSVTIPDSVTSIGDGAFCDCTSLTSVTIPDSVTSIGDGAFSGCTSLMSVTIPDSVTSIGGFSFYNCTSLTSVIISDSVTYIGDSAFSNCTSLMSVTIGNSVTRIEAFAFEGCTSLTSIKYRGTESQWDAISKGTDWDYNTGSYTIRFNYKEE